MNLDEVAEVLAKTVEELSALHEKIVCLERSAVMTVVRIARLQKEVAEAMGEEAGNG